jgi:hypothetical protein
MTTITSTGLRVNTYRVSFYEQFVVVSEHPDIKDSRRWSLWDLSGPSGHVLEYGRGDPPARLFPTGVVPEEVRG